MTQSGKKKGNVRAKVVQRSLARSQAKSEKRVAREVSKLQSLNAGDKDPHIQQLYANMQSLLKGHNDLVDHSNRNFQIYNNSFAQLDARIAALSMVAQELVDRSGLVKPAPLAADSLALDAEGNIRWEHYFQKHVAAVKDAVEKLRAEHPEQAAAIVDTAPASPLHTPPVVEEEEASDPPFIFGEEHVENQP